MPELPEVETVRNVLLKKIKNKKIVSSEIYHNNIIENDIKYFEETIKNKSIIDIKRNGKYLIFELEDKYLISHLRMEGKFYYNEDKVEKTKHDHVIINFENDNNLVYNDTRKFGKMRIIDKEEYDDYFKKIGLEPKDLTEEYLIEKFKKSNKSIKTVLLDQSIIAGLGNIYANEVLFESKIDPLKKGSEITREEINNIITSSQNIIEKSIKEGGCTIKSYTSSLGVTGNYQTFLKVHLQSNCKDCGSEIIKEKIDGRSTYYCLNCQRNKKKIQ
ncbi:MAG: DNA-formamidopyrimidine glycosylase [bacterium]